MVDQTIKHGLADLLSLLGRRSNEALDAYTYPDVRKLILKPPFAPLREDPANFFRQGYPHHGDLNGKKIYLPSPQRDADLIPMLAVKWDLGPEKTSFGVQLGCLKPSSDYDKLVFHGWRFEPPEGKPNDSHHYCHVQPITAFDKEYRMPGNVHMPDWLSDKLPTIALDAQNPVELVAAAWLCLYGLPKLDQLRVALRNSPAKTLLTKFKNRIQETFYWQID